MSTSFFYIGGSWWSRTTRVFKQLIYSQLRYYLRNKLPIKMVGTDRFELSLSDLSGLRFNQLSYVPMVPPAIFEMTTFRSSGECSYHVSYRGIIWYPQNDLNVHCWFRRPGVYPLAYKGIFGAQSRTRTGTPRRTRHFKCRMSTVPSLGHLAEMVGFRPTKCDSQSVVP